MCKTNAKIEKEKKFYLLLRPRVDCDVRPPEVRGHVLQMRRADALPRPGGALALPVEEDVFREAKSNETF